MGAVASSARAATSVVGGTVYCDVDGSHTITPGDVPLNGVTVRVTVNGSLFGDATTPDATTPGHYLIGGDQVAVEVTVDQQCVGAVGADVAGGGLVSALCPACVVP